MSADESRARHRRRDAGFTLPELLVSIIVLGSIVAVLASTIIVTFQQQDNTDGRLNVSRAEQNISMWIPADLASADEVPSILPGASPCSVDLFDLTGCPANVIGLLTGSNALLLSWTDTLSTVTGPVTVKTNVSYHFTPRPDGLFDLVRIACRSTEGGPWTCEVYTVLHDLPGPPPPIVFERGVTVPDWVLQVSAPLPPDMVEPGDPTVTYVDTKNAKRVVVTINGGGDASGRGGGINQISITAGGTTRKTLAVPSMANAPTFRSTQSRCGGPITLVVDESNSVGSDITHVRNAVTAFVTALAGTPVQIQIVRFQTKASILGDPAAWTKYYDMTNDADVSALLGAVPQLSGSWTGGQGGTNWEDAIFRTFYAADNVGAAPLPITPKTVVFFTDGVPTMDRIVNRGAPGVLTTMPEVVGAAEGWFASTGSTYSQVAFNRADYFADKWRAVADTKLIGVGVGEGFDETSQWMASPRAGYHEGWQEQSNFDYQSTIRYESNWTYQQLVYLYEQNVTTYEQSTFNYEQNVTTWEQSAFLYEQNVTTWEQSGFTYEEYQTWDEEVANKWQRRTRSPVGSWNDTSQANYEGNVSSGTYEYRINPGTWNWTNSTRAPYDIGNTTPDSSDGWRRDNPSGGWMTGRTLAQYLANNVTNDDTDEVRRVSTGAGWTPITQTVYNANNTSGGSGDGFRTTTAWATITQAAYNTGNTTPNDGNDGFRRTTTGAGWTPITQAVYNTNNYTTDSTDGFRTTTAWTPITQAVYNTGNITLNDGTDGFRRTTTGTGWSPITQAVYNTNNTTTDSLDGFRVTTAWTTITQAAYDAGNTPAGNHTNQADGFRRTGTWTAITLDVYAASNTTPDETDGFRRTAGTWTSISKAVYDANNTTADSLDGFRTTTGNPWAAITKAEYDLHNVSPGGSDGYQRINPSGSWIQVTEARHLANNISGQGDSDGARRGGKEYSTPFDSFETAVTAAVENEVILARFVSGNDNGIPWSGSLNTNEREATMFSETNWAEVPAALRAVALGECGGTLTLQTKQVSGANAVDPIQYVHTEIYDSAGTLLTHLPVTKTTSPSAPAQTLDFDIADGTYRTVVIEPVDTSDLTAYASGAWTCKAGFANRPIVMHDIVDSRWRGVSVTVGANEAVSCIHTVTAS